MKNYPLTQSFLSAEWRFILSIVAPVVAVVLAWGSFQTSQAVLETRLNKIESNELAHIQAAIDRAEEQYMLIKIEVTEIKTLLKNSL